MPFIQRNVAGKMSTFTPASCKHTSNWMSRDTLLRKKTKQKKHTLHWHFGP